MTHEYRTERRRLPAGSCLCVVSDGITEANDERQQLYGAARLEQLLADAPQGAEPSALVESVRKDVARFAGNAGFSDDVTLVVLCWRGSSGR